MHHQLPWRNFLQRYLLNALTFLHPRNRILQLSVFQIPRLMLWLCKRSIKSAQSIRPSVATQKETALPKPVTNQPLSPYTVYDDLKPPSSPSPSQPGDGKQTKISETVPKPSALDSPSSVLGVHGISQTTSLSEMEKPLFPYVAYPDLKPPTSSPNASTIPFSTSAGDGVPEIATVSSNGPAQLSIADEPKEEHLPEPKSRSLSPYTT
ncbi:Protein TIC 62, chloroplastic [Glycine max]|nr:Protein TIC 62, chloroplastic [Glycine max]